MEKNTIKTTNLTTTNKQTRLHWAFLYTLKCISNSIVRLYKPFEIPRSSHLQELNRREVFLKYCYTRILH